MCCAHCGRKKGHTASCPNKKTIKAAPVRRCQICQVPQCSDERGIYCCAGVLRGIALAHSDRCMRAEFLSSQEQEARENRILAHMRRVEIEEAAWLQSRSA